MQAQGMSKAQVEVTKLKPASSPQEDEKQAALNRDMAAITISTTLPENGVLLVDDLESLERCKAIIEKSSRPGELAWDSEGFSIGRHGSVTLVQIAVPECCFLLDVHSGVSCRDESLAFIKSLLEDVSIRKIIHDPCMDSDAMFHLHDITVVNAHDTQSWHLVLHPQTARPSLNTTLMAFGLPSNDARDKNVYKTNPKFWERRPLTTTMLQWASADVRMLFRLFDKQLEAAGGADSTKAIRAQADSQVRLDATRSSKSTCVRIHSSQIGNFIGKRGCNIRAIQRQAGADVQIWGREKGVFIVYGRNQSTLDRAVALCQEYTTPWQSRRSYSDYGDY